MNGQIDRYNREEDVKRSERHRLTALQHRLNTITLLTLLSKTLPSYNHYFFFLNKLLEVLFKFHLTQSK